MFCSIVACLPALVARGTRSRHYFVQLWSELATFTDWLFCVWLLQVAGSSRRCFSCGVILRTRDLSTSTAYAVCILSNQSLHALPSTVALPGLAAMGAFCALRVRASRAVRVGACGGGCVAAPVTLCT